MNYQTGKRLLITNADREKLFANADRGTINNYKCRQGKDYSNRQSGTIPSDTCFGPEPLSCFDKLSPHD
jgi:hypothetical protein